MALVTCAAYGTAAPRDRAAQGALVTAPALVDVQAVCAALNRAFAGGLKMWSVDVFDMGDRGDGIYVDCSRMVDGTPRRATIRFDRVYSGLCMSNDFNFIKERAPLWHSIIETNCFTQATSLRRRESESGRASCPRLALRFRGGNAVVGAP